MLRGDKIIKNQRFSCVDLHFALRTGISSNGGYSRLQSKRLFFSRLRILRK